MRTDGITKVAVFETQSRTVDNKDFTNALSDLFAEASIWFRDVTKMRVKTGAKQERYRQLYNVSSTLVINEDAELAGPTVQLMIHYDDNEKS